MLLGRIGLEVWRFQESEEKFINKLQMNETGKNRHGGQVGDNCRIGTGDASILRISPGQAWLERTWESMWYGEMETVAAVKWKNIPLWNHGIWIHTFILRTNTLCSDTVKLWFTIHSPVFCYFCGQLYFPWTSQVLFFLGFPNSDVQYPYMPLIFFHSGTFFLL